MIYFGSIKATAISSNVPFLGSNVLFLVPVSFLGSIIFPRFVQCLIGISFAEMLISVNFEETLFVGKA